MEEFEQHIHAVKRFFGEAIHLRRSIFLGDATALILPQNRLIRVFDLINQEFCFADSPSAARWAEPIFEGINSFLDVFAGERKSEMDFRELKARHSVWRRAVIHCWLSSTSRQIQSKLRIW
jgi:hypothetical protein